MSAEPHRPALLRRGPRAALALIGLGMVVAAAGCNPSFALPDTQAEATVVGVIGSSSTLPGGAVHVSFTDGRSTDVADWLNRVRAGRPPTPGDLLLRGADPDPWVATLEVAPGVDAPPGCFRLFTRGRDDPGASISTELGIRLPRAPDFDRGLGRDGIYDAPNTPFCLDQNGEATSYGW